VGTAGGGGVTIAHRVAGQAIPHESAREHVTGEALYTDDLISRFPHVLHAWPVLAPHAHALVKGMDVSAALDEPGVATVLTGDDVPGEGDSGSNRHDEPLFPAEVMYHGQPVAWVLGETLDAAQRGAARVSVDYEPLPTILTIEDAIAAGSFHSAPLRLARGDASVLESSALRFEGELRIGGQEHFYLETQCALAWLDETGGVAAHSSTQHPTETQEVIARVLGIPRNRVTVECLRMGGAFGGKEVQANAWAAIAALGAWKTRRPVRVRLTRALDFALTGKRHPFLARYEAGFAGDGRLEGVRISLYSDGGWSLDLSEPVLSRAMFHCDNAYLLPAVEITGLICRTHKTSQTAFRGFGGPQGMLVIEEILDQAARRLGLGPEIVRERNFYRVGDITHYGQPVKHAERIELIWRQLKESSGFAQRRAEIEGWNARHPHGKRGLAITPVKFGISFTATFFNQAGALVLIYRDGSVQVNHGGAEMGQGLHTKIQQIAAETLGLDLEAVRLMPTSTDKIPNTSATAASAGADLNGAAVADACSQIRTRLTEVAAGMLECDIAAVHFNAGLVSASGVEQPAISFAKVCETAYRQRVPLFAHGYYRTPDIHYDPKTGRGEPFHYFAYAAAVSEVEVDGFTGDYRLLRTDILEDVGDSVSPLVDQGQIEGGFIQGVGWLTLEELVWDSKGRLATAGASTYKLPSWTEVPDVFNVDFLERAAEPGTIFGSKAVGEPPLMLAISVREAIRDAIAAFGAGGPISFESPATPERVFFAVQRARAERESQVSSVGAIR
jgi:xanthine dehydrogenase large subunit